MDQGAWWATVHGVANSQTRLSDFTFLFYFFFNTVFFLRFFFDVDYFKVFIEFVTIFFLFWYFGHETCEILAPQSGIEPTLLA